MSFSLEKLHNDSISELGNLIGTDEENSYEIVKVLLNQSPKCDDILQLLNNKKFTPSELAVLFHSFGHILISIADNLRDYESVGIHITRWILQNHSPLLLNLLSISSTVECIKAGLHCITGMLMMGNASANEVVTNFDFEPINFKALAEMRETNSTKDIRTWLFYLILALLNTRDTRCLWHFLQVEGSVSSLFKSLKEDPPERVVKLLNLLHEVVLLNMSISKTLKVNIFKITTCRDILILYKSEDRTVIEAAHRLLLTLYGDHRHGIIFREKSNNASGKLPNRQAMLFMKSQKWLCEVVEGQELIFRTLQSCPDILKLCLMSFWPYEPHSSDSFFSLVKLLSRFIESCNPLLLIEKKLQSPKGLSRNVYFLIPGLTNNILIQLVCSSSEVLLHAGIILLTSLFKKLEEILTKLSDAENKKHKKVILRNAACLGGGANKILNCWHRCVKEEFRSKDDLPPNYLKDYPSKFPVMSLIIELYYLLAKLYGYNFLRTIFNPWHVLESIYNLPEKCILEDLNGYEDTLANVLNIILLAQKSGNFEAFGYSKDIPSMNDTLILNRQCFTLLLNIYCRNYCQISSSSSNRPYKKALMGSCVQLLEASFSRWIWGVSSCPSSCILGEVSSCPSSDILGGVSSCPSSDIQVWLEKLTDPHKASCCNFLADVIVNTTSNLFAYIELILRFEKSFCKNGFQSPIDLLTEVNSSIINDNKDLLGSQVKIPFSCLVVGAIEVLKSEGNVESIQYFSDVMGDYVHSIDNPLCLASYLISCEVLTPNMKAYFQSLLNVDQIDMEVQDKDGQLRNVFMSKKLPSASKLAIVMRSQINSEKELIRICRELILYIQLIKESNGKRKRIKFYLRLMKKLTKPENCLESADLANVFKCILEHPFIIKSYTPLQFTDLVHCEVVSLIDLVLRNYPELYSFVKPFLEKFIFVLRKITHIDDEMDMVSQLQLYTLHSSILQFGDVEHMFASSLKLNPSPQANQILVSLLQVVCSLDNAKALSMELRRALFVRLLDNLGKAKKDDCTPKMLSLLLINCIDVTFAASLSRDDMKCLVNGSFIPYELCCHIVKLHPQYAPVISKRLKKLPLDLAEQGPYVVMHLNLYGGDKHILSYLLKAKDVILRWALCSESEADAIYEELFLKLIEKEMLDPLEVSEVHSHWYTEIVKNRSKPPSHILCLKAAYLRCENYQAVHDPNLQFLAICLGIVSKFYGKKSASFPFGDVAQIILDLMPRVDKLALRNELKENHLWSSFVKKNLKASLTDQEDGPDLLMCLTTLIKTVHPDKDVGLPLSTIQEMLYSHSEFFPLLISEHASTAILKESALHLLETAVELSPDGAEEKMVAFLLCSYGASTSICDQAIFRLLFWFECSGFMPTYIPVVWGKMAISHLSVEPGGGVHPIWKPPDPRLIVSSLDTDKILRTALNFQMNVGLEPSERVSFHPDIYDQRFLLHLFLYLTDGSSSVGIEAMIEKGVLALGFASLSSHRQEVWEAGSTLLRNTVDNLGHSVHQHLKLQWIWLVAVVGYGLNCKQARLPSLMVHFLIKTTQLILAPNDVMYKTVLNYVYLKPALPLFSVPEFYILFFSEHSIHTKKERAFILELMASGIRDSLDVEVCQQSRVPRLLVGLLTSPTLDSNLKSLTFRALQSLARVPEGADILVQEVGFLTHLPLAFQPTTLSPIRFAQMWTSSALEVLGTLLATWRKDEGDWRKDEGDWRKDEGDWRKDEGDWRKDEGDWRKDEGDWRKDEGDWRKDEGDWRKDEGDWRKDEGDWRKDEGDWRKDEGDWRMNEGDWRMDEGDWRKDEDDWRMGEGDWPMGDPIQRRNGQLRGKRRRLEIEEGAGNRLKKRRSDDGGSVDGRDYPDEGKKKKKKEKVPSVASVVEFITCLSNMSSTVQNGGSADDVATFLTLCQDFNKYVEENRDTFSKVSVFVATNLVRLKEKVAAHQI